MALESWFLVITSLAGNLLVVKKNVIGLWVWLISNVGWIIYDISIGAYSQAFLFVAYSFICVWGIIDWSKADAKNSA
jgi:nicotinamide riboside transporter PnuC